MHTYIYQVGLARVIALKIVILYTQVQLPHCDMMFFMSHLLNIMTIMSLSTKPLDFAKSSLLSIPSLE